MKWFGKSWGAPVCATEDQVEVPVGKLCGFCKELIREDSRGLVMPFLGSPTDDKEMVTHLFCFKRSVGIA